MTCYRGAVSLRSLAALVLPLALSACAAPLEGGRACPEAACAEGLVCMVGRCRPADASPAPADGTRLVLSPVAAAVAAHGGSGGGVTLPDHIVLGRASNGTVTLLFRFAATFPDEAEVASAFLILDPIEGAPPSLQPVSFEMASITEPWQADIASAGRQPRLGVPRDAGKLRLRPGISARIDVTPMVRDWPKKRPDDHGLALLAKGADEAGTVVSMGVSHGTGPRLEIYLK